MIRKKTVKKEFDEFACDEKEGPVEKEVIERVSVLHQLEALVKEISPYTYLEARQFLIYSKCPFEIVELTKEGDVLLKKGDYTQVIKYRK